MKKSKRVFAAVLAVLMLAMCFVGCGEAPANSDANKNADGKYTIGICQLISHNALDAAKNGFKEAVIAGLGEENVEFLEQNESGNNTGTTIVNEFVSKDVDLIMANATGSLQAAANATADIPILELKPIGKTLEEVFIDITGRDAHVQAEEE